MSFDLNLESNLDTTEARKCLKTLLGTREHVMLQDRIGLIDAAIAVNKSEQDEHTLITNLWLLRDNIDDFPPSLLLSCTEHLVKFRMVRVFGLQDRQERLEAIESLVKSIEFWTPMPGASLLDHKHASLPPLMEKLAEKQDAAQPEG